MIGLAGLLFVTGLRIPSGLGSPILFAALYIFANIVSIVVARESGRQPFSVITVYAGLTIYFFVSYVLVAALVAESQGKFLAVIWHAWIVAGAAAAGLAILAFFNLIPSADMFMKFGRAKSAFKDPNVFGPFLVPPMLVLLSQMRKPGTARRLILIALFMLIAFGLFLSFSRGAWANFLLALAVFATLHAARFRTMKQYIVAALATSAILMIVVLALSFAQDNPRIQRMVELRATLLQSHDVESGGRFSTQREALKVIADAPLGIGPNRTMTQFGMNPHNVYIKIFMENGWLGGLSFLAFLTVIMLRGFRTTRYDWRFSDNAIIVFACLIGILTESLIIDTLHWRHVFLLLGLMSGISVLQMRQPAAMRTTS